MMTYFLSFFVLSFVMTGIARRFALWRHATSIPEFRHHHLEPVPRGGGIALVLVMIALNLIMYRYRLIDIATTRSLCFSGIFLLIGCLVHDLHPLPRWGRLLLQAGAATLAMVWFSRDLIVIILDGYWYLSGWWMPVLVLWLLGAIKLNNVMNQVDGMVASQAFSMMFASACLLAISGELAWSVPLVLVCAPILGFLAWNWPPARINMGRTGSSFLGLFINLMGMHLAGDTSINPWVWIILMSVFCSDVVTTLLYRLVTGQEWRPSRHKLHTYQLLAREWDSHFLVTLLLCALNWVWLFPLAWLAMDFERYGLFIWLVAMLPLVAGNLYVQWRHREEEPDHHASMSL